MSSFGILRNLLEVRSSRYFDNSYLLFRCFRRCYAKTNKGSVFSRYTVMLSHHRVFIASISSKIHAKAGVKRQTEFWYSFIYKRGYNFYLNIIHILRWFIWVGRVQISTYMSIFLYIYTFDFICLWSFRTSYSSETRKKVNKHRFSTNNRAYKYKKAHQHIDSSMTDNSGQKRKEKLTDGRLRN